MADNFHAQAINLARRYSIRNENDLLQENLFDDDESSSNITERYCSYLLEKNHWHDSNKIPTECQRFDNLRVQLQRRQSLRDEEGKAATIAFQGMSPNETLDAIRAREHGLPYHSQIQRRMTTHNPKKHHPTWF